MSGRFQRHRHLLLPADPVSPPKKAWVYILQCSDGSYYTGCTTDLERRVDQHNRGIGSRYTLRRRPVKLLWSMQLKTLGDAMSAERRIKQLPRSKKSSLLRNDPALIINLKRQRRRP